MEQEQHKTPINTMYGSDLIQRLQSILIQSYHRRSRTLPANIAEITETLKGDLLKHFPDCPVEVVDDAIITETLNNNDTPLSPTFFFNAVKKAWFTPKTNTHHWDNDECRRPDTEQDTINLLDICAKMLKEMDDTERDGVAVAKTANVGGVKIPLPAFNARREYAYLVMRQQLALNADDSFTQQAIEEVNHDRIRDHHQRVDKDKAMQDPDVLAQARRLAVLAWLRQCNTNDTTPSAILTPLADEWQYQQFRRKSA